MAYPIMRLDTKSPQSIVNDEESSKEQDDLLFDRRPPKSSLRPQSAKASEYKEAQRSKARKGPRPISANKPIAVRRPTGFKKEQDLTFLARLKPRHIPQDKERLYEESLALKVKINTLNEDNLKLRTRINQLEREINKRDDLINDLKTASLVDRPGISNIKSMHLVTNLKNSVRELRQDVKVRDEEITTLRKNIKSTKLSEMEVEIQAYIDECTRLRHHLEEVMRQRDQPQSSPGFNSIEEKHYQQTLLINNLRKENQELSGALNQAHDELDNMKNRLTDFEKENKKKRPKRKASDLGNFKTEIQKLKTQLEAGREELKRKDQTIESLNSQMKKAMQDKDIQLQQAENMIRNLNATIEVLKQHTTQSTPSNSFLSRNVEQKKEPSQRPQSAQKLEKPPKLLKKLHLAARNRNMLISILLSILDKRNSRVLSAIEIIQGLDQFGVKIKKGDIEKSIEILTGKKQNNIRVDLLEQMYDKYQYKDVDHSSSSEEEVQEEEKVSPPVQVPKELSKPAEKPSPPQNAPARPQTATKQPQQERSSSIRPEQPKPAELTPIKEEVKKESPPKPLPEDPRIPKIREDEVKEALTHISLRLQLHRIPKSKFSSNLFGDMDKDKEVGLNELLQIFTKPPVAFEKGDQVYKFCRFLLEPEQGDTIKVSEKTILKSPLKTVIGKMFRTLSDWEIFTPKDEEGFDRHLATIISKNKITLKEACKIYDNDGTGIITVHEFMEVIEDLDITFPPAILNYMMLLFYSHKYELNSVPYKHFIKAYGNPQDEYGPEESGYEDSQDEEERAKIVRHYLGIIAQNLNSAKMQVKDVFQTDSKGLVYPDKFMKGVQELGLEIEEEHIVVILEALQYEEEENKVCMRLDELEEILVHYGVPLGDKGYDSEKSSKYGSRKSSSDIPRFSDSDNSGHVKKVSLLDSPDNFDYSDDSPDRVTKSKFSPRLSESSPFESMSGDINRGSSIKSLGKHYSRDRLKDSKESTLSKKNPTSSRKSSISNTGNLKQEIADAMRKVTPPVHSKAKNYSYSSDDSKHPPRSPTPTPPPKSQQPKGQSAIRIEENIPTTKPAAKQFSSSSSENESPKPYDKSASSSVSSDYGLRDAIVNKTPTPPPQLAKHQKSASGSSSSSIDSDYIANLGKKKEPINRSVKKDLSSSSVSVKSYIESEESPVIPRRQYAPHSDSESSSDEKYHKLPNKKAAEKGLITQIKPESKSSFSISEDEYKEEFESSDNEQVPKQKPKSKFKSSSDSYENEFGSISGSHKDMLNKVTNLKGISPIKGHKKAYSPLSKSSSSSSSRSFKKPVLKKTKVRNHKSSSSSVSEEYSIDDVNSSVED